MNQEFLKKYGVWIAGAALVLYLLYRNKSGAVAPRLLPQTGGGADYGLETERLRQAGALDLQRLQLNSQLEAARLKAANDRFNLEQQALAQQRALEAAQRGQTLGLIGQIAQALANLFRGQQSASKSGSSGSSGGAGGGGGPFGTPPIAGSRTQLPLPPTYPIPAPNIPGLYNPPYTPEYPQINDYPVSITDWGEAPQFQTSGLDLDTGASFFDMWGYGWDYSTGFFSSNDFGGFDLFSDFPEATTPTEGQVAVSPEEYAASEGYIIEGTDFQYGY
jgi:hypothetical protein